MQVSRYIAAGKCLPALGLGRKSGHTGAVPRRRVLRGALWGLSLGSAMILVGCSTSGTSAAPTTTVPVPAVTLVSNPAAGAIAVPLDQKIQVAVTNGTLKTVSLASPAGLVKGVVAPGATSWESGLPLRPTTTYLMRADLVDSIGRVSTKRWQFTTAAPADRVPSHALPR